ncbi:mandelate racemase/muconate lactonizing enzyme family protein [Marinobacterium aestuariivivens]|uniref:Mandelate racemase/muconate lactonizing enzyme family protein n=1 Tax=Marinobacterium aestuariivivens TaxID=1698799 RepID=A0ABW2A9Q8_9GAMM
MPITSITLRRLCLPLVVPYRLSYRTFNEFEPIFVELETETGNTGFGDGHISPGSSAETREGGWNFCQEVARSLLGQTIEQAKILIASRSQESKVAASALATAIEMVDDNPLFTVTEDARLPLLVPINSTDLAEIPKEVEQLLEQGFCTFKIKVGKNVDADLRRVAAIQKAAGGRATFRIDANRAYDREQGSQFAAALDPTGIELFEQPCNAADWDANAAVASVSSVPLMLDEPICSLADIERAAQIDGVQYCKLKLKRFGSLEGLKQGLDQVRQYGMEPVLGDGLGSEVSSWMEACVALRTIRNAGEFNGFLKPKIRLFNEPLRFDKGAIALHRGYKPTLDRSILESCTIEKIRISVH